MSGSLNSKAGGSVGVQSTPDHQAPVSGQEQNRVQGGVLSRTQKQTTTTSLTARHRGMAQKPRKAKARKSRGVKAFASGGTKPGSVPGAGKGRGAVRLFPAATPKSENFQLPVSASESSNAEDESDEGTQPPSHSPKESKSEHFALSL